MALFYSIGLMSGTSMDGVDAALIQTDGESEISFIDHASIDYLPSFKLCLKEVEHIIASAKGEYDLNNTLKSSPLTIGQVIQESTRYHALAIKKLLDQQKEKLGQFLIGYHGQTFYHKPEDNKSIILGDPKFLHDQFKQTVIFNFRENDMLNGGKGAPLAPLYHFSLVQKYNMRSVCVVNCGGISNITFIPTNKMEDVIAFDVGPGNTLLDQFIRIKTHNQYQMDENGKFSEKGNVHPEMINLLWKKSLKDETFYHSIPPKALDIHDFILPEEILALSLEDGARTLAEFTSIVLAKSVAFAKEYPSLWIVAGGGFYNPTILTSLKEHLPKDVTLLTADETGWHLKSLEAQLIGYLAVRSFLKKTLSYPNTTGVKEPVSGGDIFIPTLR